MHVAALDGNPKEGAEIRLLDPQTINQIAAGEVVERPASVVKELIENSIDSGAKRVVLELVDSGITRITVSDDGSGIPAAMTELAFQRHATSKIRTADDLSSVMTLGFRGEALPSIASVSRLTLSTGTEDGIRTVVRVEGGNLLRLSASSGPRGTEVVVEDLFYNVPARLKFLKSGTTELGQCLEVATKYALAHPHIAFHVTHNGHPAISTPGDGDLLTAIAGVWNWDVARALSPVEATIGGIEVEGFVSPPHFTKPTRSMQYLFVNGRPIRNRTLTVAIDQAYRMLTPEKRHPVVVLKLRIDPARVDVNVSPTKSEVKFEHEGTAFDSVRYSIKQALLDGGMIPSADSIASVNEALVQAAPSFAIFENPLTASNWEDSVHRSPSPPGDVMPAPGARYPFGHLMDGLKVLGQIFNTFIVAENRRGLVVIDQHVAHERVIYEYLCGLKGPSAIEVQRLLQPETLHLDRRSAVLLAERLDAIREIGYDIEPFGGESFVVRAAPAALRGKDPLKVLADLADELVESAFSKKLTPSREAIWIMSSCKMAIKAGDPLSIPEMEKLIADLAETENPYLCPHGRPITVTLGLEDLLRKFGRK